MSGKNTREYQRLRKCNAKLRRAFLDTIGDGICAELVSCGLISDDQSRRVRKSSDGASDLVSLLLNRVDQDSQKFYKLIDVLEREPTTYSTVLQDLRLDGHIADTPTAAPVTSSPPPPPPPPEHLFSVSMSDVEFLDLLKRKGYPEKDCSKLTDNGIGAQVFSEMAEDEIDDASLGFTFGGKKVLKKLLKEIKSGEHARQAKTVASTTHNSCVNETPGPYLTINELAEVNKAIRDARAKWNFIGLELGVSPGDIDSIKSEYRGDPAQCLSEVIQKFLQKVTPSKPSWSRVVNALESDAVGRPDIAQEVRDKYIE